jgi:glutathione S-transferase
MSNFVLHTIPGSPYGRSALLALEEKGARYSIVPVKPGTTKSEPYISLHPFGRIPTFEHDGFVLYETQAILRYLDRILPEPALTPTDAKPAARMDQLMNIADWYLFQGVNAVIGFQRVVGPRLMGLTPDEAAITACMPKAHVAFNELSRLLGTKKYFADEKLTLADLMIAPHLDFLAEAPEWAALTQSNPNLISWLARMNERPSMKATTWERVAELAKAA